MKIVITGISQGIGKELAFEFLKHGHTVVGTTRDKASVNEKLIDHPNLTIFESDFTRHEEYKRLAQLVKSELRELNILINNAGYLAKMNFENISEEGIDKSIRVNFKMPLFIIQHLIPYFSEDYNHIVNISSKGGVQGTQKFPGLSAYSSAKGALNVLTECVNEEFEHLTCNSLSLGAVQTSMLEEAFPGHKAPVQAADMAGFIYRFSVSEGRMMSGQNILVSVNVK